VRLFLNGLLKKMLKPERKEEIGDGQNSIMRIVTFRDHHHIFG
jgi:hypothetical protein